MVYMFLDERYEEHCSPERWIFACVVSSQAYWDTVYRDVQKIGEMSKKRHLRAVLDFFNRPGCFAVVTHADIPKKLIPAREVDSTDEIPQMSRRNTAWSQCILSTMMDALHRVSEASKIDLEIEVYHDPKSLTEEHRRAFKQVIQDVLPTFPLDRNIRFGKIAAIEK